MSPFIARTARMIRPVIGDESDPVEVVEVARAEDRIVIETAAVVAGEVRPGDVEQAHAPGRLDRAFDGRLQDAQPVVRSDLAARHHTDEARRQIVDPLEHIPLLECMALQHSIDEACDGLLAAP